MLWLSGIFGAVSGMVGSGVSALMANLPAGAVIVLTASAVFLFSLLFGTARGMLRLILERSAIRRKIARENLLREMYEWIETHAEKSAATGPSEISLPFKDLLSLRSWNRPQLQRALRKLQAEGLTAVDTDHRYRLTKDGLKAAKDVVRKHRLWEAYLITHADIAPGQVDWGADEIEHVLDKSMIENLERLLPSLRPRDLPPSPHHLQSSKGTA
jgi:manganese/zinc/iron transport system permease protein